VASDGNAATASRPRGTAQQGPRRKGCREVFDARRLVEILVRARDDFDLAVAIDVRDRRTRLCVDVGVKRESAI
jgi:hypothetical protein